MDFLICLAVYWLQLKVALLEQELRQKNGITAIIIQEKDK